MHLFSFSRSSRRLCPILWLDFSASWLLTTICEWNFNARSSTLFIASYCGAPGSLSGVEGKN